MNNRRKIILLFMVLVIIGMALFALKIEKDSNTKQDKKYQLMI